MLRHATGYKLANDGQDTRSLQHYLGHKEIRHTVVYTELSPERFKNFGRTEFAREAFVRTIQLQIVWRFGDAMDRDLLKVAEQINALNESVIV